MNPKCKFQEKEKHHWLSREYKEHIQAYTYACTYVCTSCNANMFESILILNTIIVLHCSIYWPSVMWCWWWCVNVSWISFLILSWKFSAKTDCNQQQHKKEEETFAVHYCNVMSGNPYGTSWNGFIELQNFSNLTLYAAVGKLCYLSCFVMGQQMIFSYCWEISFGWFVCLLIQMQVKALKIFNSFLWTNIFSTEIFQRLQVYGCK